MRLINNESMKLEEFMGGGPSVPPYAILSHTWGDEEITFQDFTHGDQEMCRKKKGFAKIKRACELAKEAGLEYSWVDTCCIDKSSSAELTEAINSMFQWYKAAVVCFAWLDDLPAEQTAVSLMSLDSPLSNCRWFTRGWTLQELIAPRRVEFYDQAWNFRGTKTDLSEPIIEITKITADVLADPSRLSRLSVAQRMSWVSSRQTTRIEDMAYCLLGIFDVNMPMLYGEGERAFLRLQEEIAKSCNDMSLFAWKATPTGQTHHGIFATSTVYFRDSGSIRLTSDVVFNPEFAITNKGLKIMADLYSGTDGPYVMKINCAESTASGNQQLGIWILPHGGGVYGRVKANEFASVNVEGALKPTSIYLFGTVSSDHALDLEGSESNAFMFRKGFNQAGKITSTEFPFQAVQMMPTEEWDSQRRMFLTHGASEFTGRGYFMKMKNNTHCEELMEGTTFILAFGISEGEAEPWIAIASPYDGAVLYQHMQHDKKLSEAARERKNIRSVLVWNKGNTITHQVTVSLEKTRVSGLVVYCIDLVCEPAQEENFREDTPGGIITTMWKNRKGKSAMQCS